MRTRKVSELRAGDVVRLSDGREAEIERVDRMRIFDGNVRHVVWRVESERGEGIHPGDAGVELVREGGDAVAD